MARRSTTPLLVSLLLAAACAAGVPEPTAVDEERARSRWPDATLAELARGRSLYVEKCAGCHALKSPHELSAEQWSHEVDEMRQSQGVRLSEPEATAIVRYLSTLSAR